MAKDKRDQQILRQQLMRDGSIKATEQVSAVRTANAAASRFNAIHQRRLELRKNEKKAT